MCAYLWTLSSTSESCHWRKIDTGVEKREGILLKALSIYFSINVTAGRMGLIEPEVLWRHVTIAKYQKKLPSETVKKSPSAGGTQFRKKRTEKKAAPRPIFISHKLLPLEVKMK